MLIPTIGIEVHVELKSKSKVFSNTKNDFHDLPNTNINVIDFGYPGTLPMLNKEVVDMALKAAIAMHCNINQTMHFDRKNYFYPDLPKGYQITQMDTPIGYDGYLEILVDGQIKKIGIERIHIEEDTCKSIHEQGTLLNYNRAGVPLVEIVSRPDIKSPEEAVLYLEKLRETMLYLGISDVKIEEGSMRCDANISLHEDTTDVFGVKCEIKNIGSISNVGIGLAYEMKRQKELIEAGELIREQTRRFDDKTNTTSLMRYKETGNDYRYFPEPDLPIITIDSLWLEHTKASIPVMPDELRTRYRHMKINENNIKTLISNMELGSCLDSVVDQTDPVIAANLLTGEILAYLNKNYKTLQETEFTPTDLIDLIAQLQTESISNKQVKELIPALMERNCTVTALIKEMGLEQVNDVLSIQTLIQGIVEANPDSILDFQQGKDKAVKFLMGQIMKESKGTVNPKMANELLTECLKKYEFDK